MKKNVRTAVSIILIITIPYVIFIVLPSIFWGDKTFYIKYLDLLFDFFAVISVAIGFSYLGRNRNDNNRL
ncbi:hypothetical protein CWI77_08025 [Pseudidiomarina planktonica]|nr:hypothetical protein CWI77_08025 [Pseudidiomarina planktonica]